MHIPKNENIGNWPLQLSSKYHQEKNVIISPIKTGDILGFNLKNLFNSRFYT